MYSTSNITNQTNCLLNLLYRTNIKTCCCYDTINKVKNVMFWPINSSSVSGPNVFSHQCSAFILDTTNRGVSLHVISSHRDRFMT